MMMVMDDDYDDSGDDDHGEDDDDVVMMMMICEDNTVVHLLHREAISPGAVRTCPVYDTHHVPRREGDRREVK